MVSPAVLFGQAMPRIVQPVDESALVTLKGNTHPLARPQFDRGPVDDSVAGRMLLVLKRSPEQETALRQLVQDQQTPGSPSFHKWLTPEQFGQQFGVADADLQSVTSYLQANGFGIGRIYKNKSAIEISGTAGQLRNTFHTQIHSYAINGHEFYANANDPQIPQALAPVVRGFASLNNIRQNELGGKTPASIPVTFDPETHRAQPNYTGNIGFGTFYLMTPADIQTVYNAAVQTTSPGAGGTGVTVGVVGDSQINLDLVKRYQSLTGLPSNVPVEIVDGADPAITPTTTGSDATIAYEQVELLYATAPYATVNYYTSSTTDYDNGLTFAIIRAVEDNAVSVLTIGFQTCEANLTAIGNAQIEAAWLQAAAQGITVVAAAGDTGSAGCDTPGAATSSGGLAVNGYASTPYNVAVGGTDFYYGLPATNYWNATNTATYGSAKSYIPEQAWNNSITTNDSNAGTSEVYGGGGGFSTLGNVAADGVTESAYPVPSWQVSAQQASGILTPTARSIPDVSMFAGNGYNSTWYAFCSIATDCTGTLPNATIAGGTAGSAAVFAGIMAEVVQKYGAQGNANPALYGLASTNGIFHAVTTGNNSMACSGGTGCSGGYLKTGVAYAYTSGIGYDEATGLGSVNAGNLVTGWKVPATKATTTSLAITNFATGAAVTSVVHGTILNLAATVTGTGTPTGNVSFTTGSNLPAGTGLIAEPLVSGVATSTYNYFLPGGTYNVTARYGGDSTFLPSVGTYPITVTPEPSRTFIWSSTYASPATVTYGTKISVTSEAFSLNNNNVSTPTGTMSVYSNGGNDPIVVLPLSSEGTATLVTNLLGGSQTYSLVFTYSGDPSYQISSNAASPYVVSVTQAATTTSLAASGSASAKTPITLVATVASPASLATGVPPTGTVTFNTAGGNTVVALTGGFSTTGQAIGIASTQVTTTQIPTGGTIMATYSSDANYAGSTGTLGLTKNNTNYAGGSSSLTESFSSTTVSTAGPLTINVTATEPNNNPQGAVQVFANGVSIGSFTIAAGSGGKASWPVPVTNGYLPFASGTVTITAVFTPSLVTYAPSSTTGNITVTDNRTVGDFSVSTQTQTQTINSSTNDAFFKVQIASIQNFAGLNDPITLSCTVPTGSNLGCTLGNTYVTLGSSGTAITTLEVYGKPTGGTGALHPPVQPQRWWLVGGGSALACVFILGIPARRKGLQGMMAALICAVMVTGSITGCGSNSLAANAIETGNPTRNGSGGSLGASYTNGLATNTVAPGTYSVLITGTATSNTAVTHNTLVEVIVNTGITFPNGSYSLTNFNTQNLMTDPNGSTSAGTGMVLNSADGTSDQKWIFTYQNNGYYTIKSAASGLYVTDPGSQSGNVQVLQEPASNDGTQLWTLNALEGGYEVVNAASGGVLDDEGFGTAQGNPTICYPQKSIIDALNQTWYINPAP
jgi:subtilase family serine protease